MKNESAESRRKLPMAAGSAEIYDFLYVDRARISALYAQLFPQGVLSTVKTTALQSFSDEGEIGSDVKIIKAEAKSTESGSEGIEHFFDASWSVPLEVLTGLKGRSLVRESLAGSGLGSIILTDCHLRLIDFASMDKVWEPAMKMSVASSEATGQIPADAVLTIAETLRAMPHAIHAHFLTSEALLWSSLQPANLTIPTADLTLKYGGGVSGLWSLLYLLDAWSDKGEAPDVSSVWSAGPLIDGVLTAMHGLRGIMGRPAGWIGITPLMLYRDIAGWLPSVKEV